MLRANGQEISAADVPLRIPADGSGLGVERVGAEPGNDAGGSGKPEESGNHPKERNGAGYRPKETEGLQVTQKEAEEKIGKLLMEIRDIYHEYYPEGKQLNMAIVDEHCWAFNAYWEKDKEHPMDLDIREEAK